METFKEKLAKLLAKDINIACKNYTYIPMLSGEVLFLIEDRHKMEDVAVEFTPEEFEVVRKIFDIPDAESQCFISKDRQSIHLPVPLGTVVYEYLTSCDDVCSRQKAVFDSVFPVTKTGRCHKDMPCHTKPYKVSPVEVTLKNVAWLLREWNQTVFRTEAEATKAMNAAVRNHREQMLHLGMAV